MRTGNAYSASLYLALISLIDNQPVDDPTRVGLFSYGSGCASEFFSGVIPMGARKQVGDTKAQLDQRALLDIPTYDRLVDMNEKWGFGTRTKTMEFEGFNDLYQQKFEGKSLLVLEQISDFHRKYRWS